MGVGIGVTLGATLRSNIPDFVDIGKIHNFGENRSSLIDLKRSLVGLAYLVLQRYVTKKLVYLVLRYFYYDESKQENNNINMNGIESNGNYVKKSLIKREKFDLKQLIENNYLLELFYYVTCYGAIGFSAVFTCFFIYEYLGLV